MTLFAGAYSLDPDRALPRSLKNSLTRNLCHDHDKETHYQTHDISCFFLVKWDSGAFAEPAWSDTPNGSVCALAGDPLLVNETSRPSRAQQMEKLAPASGPLQISALAQCRGSFALVRYAAEENRLYLACDAVGLRSLYYVIQDGILIFSTALRVLESMAEIDKTLSLPGMVELCAFSFPLAERTPYKGINILRECEILIAGSGNWQIQKYDDWSTTGKSSEDISEAAIQLYATFEEAVRIRAGNDTRMYSFLSGGMDSRAIVATLIGMGRQVEALNFSSTDSQDQKYAQLFAADAGRDCRLHCLPGGNFPNFSLLAHAAKTALEQRESISVERPRFIWSGDGGSVGLGHVYMDQAMLDSADRGDIEAAIKHFFQFNRIALPNRVLTSSARERLPQMLFDNVLAEINRYPRQDMGRQLYLFLLFNDQRHHLFKHFETIDQHGLELLTPFYDAKFLKEIAATPVRWGVRHQLYAHWFKSLPGFARQTPWQTYPGHEPCPVLGDPHASYQWAKESGQNTPLAHRVKLALELIRALNPRTPPQIFSRPGVWLAALLHASGVRDCRYILHAVQAFQYHGAKTRTQQAASSQLT